MAIPPGALVYFDIETTSLRPDCEITQIAAVWKYRKFNVYSVPYGNISYRASELTGITKHNDELYVNDVLVDACDPADALRRFIGWLNRLDITVNNGMPILVGHHAHVFDMRRLQNNAENFGLDQCLDDAIDGYIDTLPLVKSKYPDLESYSLWNVLGEFGIKSYAEHNALEDARALRALMTRTQLFRDSNRLLQFYHEV